MIHEVPEIARASTSGKNNWREIIPSGLESASADGVSLEHLIDLKRAHASQSLEES